MKVLLIVLLLPITFVGGLAPRKLVVKSRSLASLETATGVKADLPLNKKKEEVTKDKDTKMVVYQPRPAILQLVLDENRDYDDEYWYHPQIHTLGNAGIFGALHAALAPLSTYIIDTVAYNGIDIRFKVAQELRDLVNKGEARVLDMCCGVGMSTRALRRGFPDAQAVIGLDTSPQMVAMANFLTNHLSIVQPWFQGVKKRFTTSVTLLEEQRGKLRAATGCIFRGVQFKKGNAENTKLPDQSFDLVTVMYALHEAPKRGREKIIKEARRLLAPGGILAIIDISSDYEPSPNMLAGEPYVIEYQQNMSKQLRRIKGFLQPEYKTLVPGHVAMWTLKRSPSAV